ncbi:MAG: hypothetical protein ACPG1C_04185 [Alphaproteobacteria bacterium]
MEATDDFELLDPEYYSNFDQSDEREADMARVFAYNAEDKTGEREREYLSVYGHTFRDFGFQGTLFKELMNNETGLGHVAGSCTRILAQFKVKTGYLLIVDRDTTRRVLRLPGILVDASQCRVSDTLSASFHQSEDWRGRCPICTQSINHRGM